MKISSVLDGVDGWIYNTATDRPLYEHITFPVAFVELTEEDHFKITYTVMQSDTCVIIDDREAAEKIIAAIEELKDYGNYNIKKNLQDVVLQVYDDSSEEIISVGDCGDVQRISILEDDIMDLNEFMMVGDHNIGEQELKGVFRIGSRLYMYVYESNYILVDSRINLFQSDIINTVYPIYSSKFLKHIFDRITVQETVFITEELYKYVVANSI